jgi:hypothetical protein
MPSGSTAGPAGPGCAESLSRHPFRGLRRMPPGSMAGPAGPGCAEPLSRHPFRGPRRMPSAVTAGPVGPGLKPGQPDCPSRAGIRVRILSGPRGSSAPDRIDRSAGNDRRATWPFSGPDIGIPPCRLTARSSVFDASVSSQPEAHPQIAKIPPPFGQTRPKPHHSAGIRPVTRVPFVLKMGATTHINASLNCFRPTSASRSHRDARILVSLEFFFRFSPKSPLFSLELLADLH